jgi:DNA-binding winged helix-turn-helix (wHTH) protein
LLPGFVGRKLISSFSRIPEKRFGVSHVYCSKDGVMVPNLTSTLEPEMAAGPSRAPALSSRYIRFGPFQVDQHRQEVSKNGARLKLQGKVYHVLVALIEKQGEVVTREELRVRLWPADTHVNYDANVNTTVNKLRLALGDSSETPLYIETIPRKGYCLIVRPEFADVPVTVAPVTPSSNPVNAKPQAEGGTSPKSDIWVTLGIIGLILGGMLLGAGITKLWISHFVPTPGGFWF